MDNQRNFQWKREANLLENKKEAFSGKERRIYWDNQRGFQWKREANLLGNKEETFREKERRI